MSELKKNTEVLKKEDPARYRHEIEWNEDWLKQFKAKAIVS